MGFFEYFLAISMTCATAAGFVFLWHSWSATRSKLTLIFAIAVTALVAVAIAFSIATLILYLLNL